MRENGMTISELARLMQVAVHQIRYFEEKEVLLPAYIGDNQYRMYGLDEVYRLAHIFRERTWHYMISQPLRRLSNQAEPVDVNQRSIMTYALPPRSKDSCVLIRPNFS